MWQYRKSSPPCWWWNSATSSAPFNGAIITIIVTLCLLLFLHDSAVVAYQIDENEKQYRRNGTTLIADSQQGEGNETSLSPSFFIDVIFKKENSMTIQDLKSLLTSLQAGPKWLLNQSIAERHNRTDNQQECLSVDRLLEIYGIAASQNNNSISVEQFRSICPALIHQHRYASPKVCTGSVLNNDDDGDRERDLVRYGYGTLAIFVISYLPSGVLLSLPDAKNPKFPYFMHTARGLATSAMVSYVMLLLLPNAFGAHSAEEEGTNVAMERTAKFSPTLFKSVAFLCTLYAMYLLEMIIGTRIKVKNAIMQKTSEQPENFMNESSEPSVTIANDKRTPPTKQTIAERVKGFFLDCIPPKTFGWMLIMGDSIDNFMDGLAIGAMFSISLTDGICTSIAILVHEIPNEIGDFGALLSTGMPWRGCMTWNLMESCAAFIGLYVGLRFSTDESSQQFMCALTAGIFLYVSLTGILPELHDIKETFWFSFFLQNIGIQFGFWSMFLITVYEEAMSHMLD